MHTGHAAMRDTRELSPVRREPLPPESVTIARLLLARGYATTDIGRGGSGPPGSSGEPAKHGRDLFSATCASASPTNTVRASFFAARF